MLLCFGWLLFPKIRTSAGDLNVEKVKWNGASWSRDDSWTPENERSPQGRARTCWRGCLPADFGTPQCAPRGDWRGGLCVSALTAAPMDPMNMDPDEQQIIHGWMNALSHISVKRLYFFKKKNCKALVKNRSNFHWYSWFNQTKIHKKKPAKIGDISQVDVWIPHSTLHLWTCESTSKMK